MSAPELSMVIPAYNEANHLEPVVSDLAKTLGGAGIDYEIRVVNNGSTDSTGEILEKLHRENPRIVELRLAVNQGYGGGVLSGLHSSHGAVVGWVHADGQASPHDIVNLYQKMRTSGCELAKAVRVVRHESPWRIVQSKIYHGIFRLLFWVPYRDINGTPRLLARHAFEKLNLQSRDWFLEPEFMIKAIRLNMPISEVEIVWNSRRSGSTRAHMLTGLEFLKNLILYRIGVKK